MKGLSPFIAVVLLVAFSMTMGLVLFTWSGSFMSSELEKSSKCMFGLEATDAVFDSGLLRIDLLNSGGQNLTNFLASVVYVDSTLDMNDIDLTTLSGNGQQPANSYLEPEQGTTAIINITAQGGDGSVVPIRIDVYTENCPQTVYKKNIRAGAATTTTIPPTILDLQVSASSDDADDDFNSWSLTHGSINLGRFFAGYVKSGYRFTDVTIPSGSTINTAYFTFTATNDKTGDVTGEFRGIDEANPATFSDEADFDSRPVTSAVVSWTLADPWEIDAEYNTADLKSIIQELVDTYDYSSGAPMAFKYQATTVPADTRKYAYSYDLDTSKAAKLHIEYTVP